MKNRPRPIQSICLICIFIFAALAGFVPAFAQEGNRAWQPVGLSGGGAMFNPVICPAEAQVAMVHCDMSAAYLTHDGGATWRMIDTSQLRSNTRCRAAFDPGNPQIIYSPSGSSEIKVSRDGGMHWESLAHFDGGLVGPICVDAHNPSRMFVGVGSSGGGSVRYSGDQGKNWRACDGPKGNLVGAYFWHSGQNAACFVATDGGVWRCDDDAKTWQDASEGLPFKGLRGFTGGSKDGRFTLYCTLPGQAQGGQYAGGIYRRSSGAKAWEPANGNALNLETKPFDQWASNPVAQYFQIETTDQRPEVVWVSGGGTGVPPPHHLTLYRSDDAGKNWHDTFLADPRYPGCNVEKDYTVVEDGQFYSGIAQFSVDAHNPGHVLQIMGGECYYTSDDGVSWRAGHTQCAGQPIKGCAWTCTGLVVTTTWRYYIDPHEPNRHYICYTDIGFARSLDAGKTWLWWSQAGRPPWTNTCYELAIDPAAAGRIWGAFSQIHDIPNANIIYGNHRSEGGGGICRSDDFAATWTPLKGDLPVAPATAIVLDPKSSKDSRTLYAGFFGKGVYKSTDGGKNWSAKNAGLGDGANLRVCDVQIHPDGTLFALITALRKDGKFQSGGVGLYRSSDGGDSWQCLTSSISALWPKAFAVDGHDSRTIYLGLCDNTEQKAGGLWRTTDGGQNWSRIFRESNQHFGAFLSPSHPGWIYATLCEDAPKYGLYLSKDNGKNFEPLKGMPFDNAMRVTFDPANAAVIYVTTFGGSIWRGPAD